jgi:glyoxylase-like metal-dependent hydrolase (beta-lactamase superfamily II)
VIGPFEIVSGVYGLGSEMVNWYVVEDEGRLTAVDAGMPAFRNDLATDLGKIGHRLEDVDAVVLTHSDADHTGVVPALREAGARVLIHADDEDTLRRPRQKGGDASLPHLLAELRRPRVWRLLAHLIRGGAANPPKVEGAETFSDGEVLDVPGRPRAVHTPGHTPGHCVLHFERHGVLFVGDALVMWNLITGKRGPQVAPSAFNVSTDGAFDSLAAIEPVEAETLLPGHGEPWREGTAAAIAVARTTGRS